MMAEGWGASGETGFCDLPLGDGLGNGWEIVEFMRIYFMGICGTAMGNAALLARIPMK